MCLFLLCLAGTIPQIEIPWITTQILNPYVPEIPKNTTYSINPTYFQSTIMPLHVEEERYHICITGQSTYAYVAFLHPPQNSKEQFTVSYHLQQLYLLTPTHNSNSMTAYHMPFGLYECHCGIEPDLKGAERITEQIVNKYIPLLSQLRQDLWTKMANVPHLLPDQPLCELYQHWQAHDCAPRGHRAEIFYQVFTNWRESKSKQLIQYDQKNIELESAFLCTELGQLWLHRAMRNWLKAWYVYQQKLVLPKKKPFWKKCVSCPQPRPSVNVVMNCGYGLMRLLCAQSSHIFQLWGIHVGQLLNADSALMIQLLNNKNIFTQTELKQFVQDHEEKICTECYEEEGGVPTMDNLDLIPLGSESIHTWLEELECPEPIM